MYSTEQLAYSDGSPIGLGDWVRVFLPHRGVWHHGIVRRIMLVAGVFVVEIAHNMKSTGIVVTDLVQFADAQPIFLHRRPLPVQVPEILARVDASVGKPYHVFAQNCEHFASFALMGRAESASVRTVVALTLAGVVLVGLSKS
jgi:hypothetical protein